MDTPIWSPSPDAAAATQMAAFLAAVEHDWDVELGDTAALGAMLDRLLHHGHVLKCGPRSWRTKAAATVGE